VFGQVEQIFKTRSDKLKNLVESMPFAWLSLLAAFAILAPMFGRYIHHFPPALAVVQLCVSIFLGIVCYGFFRKSRVYFRHLRQDQKERTAAWKDRAEKLIWLLIGVALGAIGDHLKR
jgi:hypothetical protein